MPENIENEKLDNDVNEENTAAESSCGHVRSSDRSIQEGKLTAGKMDRKRGRCHADGKKI